MFKRFCFLCCLVAIGLMAFGAAHAQRIRQPLEAFDLALLKIETIELKGKCGAYALVLDPAGYVHRVFRGDYIGKNFGQVRAFSKNGLQLTEVIEESPENWQERSVWLLK